ncbi:MAG: HpcH/HpaI aldolase/citrate lyase family protein [Steroidobacteraceae bacterium]
MRSMLFVPGDRPERFEKAENSGADAVIFDLEDAVAAERRVEARGHIADYLRRSSRTVPLWVRINPIDVVEAGVQVALADLAAIVAARPDGIMLPKARHGDDVRRLDHWLEALEASAGLMPGVIRVIPMITETAGALLAMSTFASMPARVIGATWGAEDLATDLGALGNRHASGRYEAPYVWASSLCLTAAAAAGVLAIDTVDTEIRDIDAMRARARESRRMGYVGKLAIHPAQVAAIHDAFTPSDAELEEARNIIAAFEAAPGVGALRIEGKLIDRPHWVKAQRVLAAARRR